MSSFKKSFIAGVLALGAIASPALASDPTPAPERPLPFDIYFGGKVMSEYQLRSVSMTSSNPAVMTYVELALNSGFYAGFIGVNVDFGATDPYAEFDYYGGFRHSFGKLGLDVGYLYIDYVGEEFGPSLDFWKIYGVAKYALTDSLTVGANVYWTDEQLGFSGIEGTHAAMFGKLVLPDYGLPSGVGSYVSAELGRQWLSDDFAPEYNYWNIGYGLTYKALTLDLRYTGADLSDSECVAFIGQDNSCGDRFLATLSFDMSLSKLP